MSGRYSTLTSRELSSLDVFARLPPDELAAAGSLWMRRLLEPGEVLWLHGQQAEELAVLVRGEMVARIADEDVGRIPQGNLVGEAAALCSDWRTASVFAETDCELLVISSRGLRLLRAQHATVYERLLHRALDQIVRQIQEVDRHIAQLAEGGTDRPKRKKEGAFASFVQRLTGAHSEAPPPALPALRQIGVLKDAPSEAVIAISAALTPHRVRSGQPVFLEGDPGDGVFLLVDGCVEVVRGVRGGRGEVLANLFAPALFGTGSLLTRERRNASCVAAETTDCWVFEMSSGAFRGLRGEAGLLWRQVLLSALWFQLSRADQQLVKLKRGGEAVSETDLARVRSGLVSYQVAERS